jgi:hypothetical protein
MSLTPAVSALLKASCPTATQDVRTNLKNRKKAIDDASYGPLNHAVLGFQADQLRIRIKNNAQEKSGRLQLDADKRWLDSTNVQRWTHPC